MGKPAKWALTVWRVWASAAPLQVPPRGEGRGDHRQKGQCRMVPAGRLVPAAGRVVPAGSAARMTSRAVHVPLELTMKQRTVPLE